MSAALKNLKPAQSKKSLLQVREHLLRYCGEARKTLSALKLSRKGPDCECIGKSQKGPDCECIGKNQKGPDCECIGAKPKAVSFVQLGAGKRRALRADPAPEDQLAKEMTHDLEMNFNKIAPFGKEDTAKELQDHAA